MGKLITIAGNLGAGKTTLTKLLCEGASLIPYWEKPEVRPFHLEFVQDMKRWALANQMDFFLFRMMQELDIRKGTEIGVQDGGFDQDFHVFTRYLHQQGDLGRKEFKVCEDFYTFARNYLPPPDLIIRIVVSMPTLLQRRARRGRSSDDQLFRPEKLLDLELLLDEWLTTENPSPVIPYAFEQDPSHLTPQLQDLINQVKKLELERMPHDV